MVYVMFQAISLEDPFFAFKLKFESFSFLPPSSSWFLSLPGGVNYPEGVF